MTTTPTSSTVLSVPDTVFTDTERMALAGFLAGYNGLTRDAPASTTTATPSAWTATRSAHCWLPPGWAPRPSTPSFLCWLRTTCGSPKPSAPTSSPSASSAATAS